ncbi:hypothetical protein BQ8482_330195 [Mesorhizobium delmotii]|uniref:Uncharacterized protein n=1 Tax=Mesorhizobium delmotii TaxID=1631247 RepID=A0A2P9APH8_9HYPH|nr:hypothetical protein BQ8482_330195 [Mesorhizobium delmotii]
MGAAVAGDAGTFAGAAGAVAMFGFIEDLAAAQLLAANQGLGTNTPVARAPQGDGGCHGIS